MNLPPDDERDDDFELPEPNPDHIRPRTLADVLSRHVNAVIGINYRNPEVIEAASLLSVSQDHFSVVSSETGLTYHFPLRMILSALEADAGHVSVASFVSQKEYTLVVHVLHMIVYKGGVSVGMMF